MILVAFRHGHRVSELRSLQWDQIDFQNGKLRVRRLKNVHPSVHLVGGEELVRFAHSSAMTRLAGSCS